MKVIQVVNTLAASDGGPARNAYELSQQLNLAGRNHTSQLFYWRKNMGSSVFLDQFSKSGWLGTPDWIKQLHFSTISQFKLALQEADVLIIHGYYLPWVPILALVARASKLNVFLIPHGSLTDFQQSRHRSRKWFWNKTVGYLTRRFIDGFLVGSEQEKTDLMRYSLGKPITVIGVGTHMSPSSDLVSLTPSEPVRLLSLSRIARKKRVELSIASVAVLLKKGFKAKLTIVGDGDQKYFTELQELVIELGLSDHVKFEGERVGQDKLSIIKSSHLFLFPSLDENFGITVAEMAAAGLPIVSSDQVAAAKLLLFPVCTIVQDPTPETLAQAIIDFPWDNLSQIRKDAIRQAAAVFSWQAVISRLVVAVSKAH